MITAKTKINNHIKSSPSRKAFLVFDHVLFALFSLICFYPFWYVLIQSLSKGNSAANAIIVPIDFTLENYIEVLQMDDIMSAFMISLSRTVVGTVTSVFCCMYAGYLFTKQDMPFRKVIYRMMVITMYVGGGLIPTFLCYKAYGLMNTFAVYWVPGLFGAYNIILMKTFVEQLPAELEESARIDGASTMRVLLSIIIPLSVPIMATIAIYVSNSQWNSWFDFQLYNVTEKSLTPLQYLLYNYLNRADEILKQLREADASASEMARYMTPHGVKMTVTMLSVLPIICVYPFMSRYLIKGIMVGAVKG